MSTPSSAPQQLSQISEPSPNGQYQSQYRPKYSNQNLHSGGTLWMGDIDGLMDERFIKTSFNLMGEKVTYVKVVRDKTNGLPIGYGFVSFEDNETAQRVLRDVNGQQIPNAPQGKRFRLNHTSSKESIAEFSIYVGDLSPEVDDYTLLAAFGAIYKSTCSAKVMTRPMTGESKGFGFVRFTDEADYHAALNQCQKSAIVGSSPIYVKAANPRRGRNEGNFKHNAPKRSFSRSSAQSIENQNQEMFYPSEMNPYFNSNHSYGLNPYWYYGYMNTNPVTTPYQIDAFGNAQNPQFVPQPQFYCIGENGQIYYPAIVANTSHSQTLVDHGHAQPIDAVKLNEEMVAKSQDLYSSLESSRWTGIECDKETAVQ